MPILSSTGFPHVCKPHPAALALWQCPWEEPPQCCHPGSFWGQHQPGMGARHREHHLQQELSAGIKGGGVHPVLKALEEICLFRTELCRLFSLRIRNGNDNIKILMRFSCQLVYDYRKMMLLTMIYRCFSVCSRRASVTIY